MVPTESLIGEFLFLSPLSPLPSATLEMILDCGARVLPRSRGVSPVPRWNKKRLPRMLRRSLDL